MQKPGDPCGPYGLPASYSREQLDEWGWCEEKKTFTKAKNGPWGSRLNDGRWQDQGNRSRFYQKS